MPRLTHAALQQSTHTNANATIDVQTLIFRELVAVRYIEAKEKEIPLFRTLQWVWFWAAAFYGYGDWLHEFSMEVSVPWRCAQG